MTRKQRLAAWLRREAAREAFSASVLEKMERGDPSHCETRARLFLEIAEILAKSAQEVIEPPRATQAAPESVKPPVEPPSDPSRRMLL